MMYVFLIENFFRVTGLHAISKPTATKNLNYTLQFCGTVLSFLYLDFLLGGLSDVGISNTKLCLL